MVESVGKRIVIQAKVSAGAFTVTVKMGALPDPSPSHDMHCYPHTFALVGIMHQRC